MRSSQQKRFSLSTETYALIKAISLLDKIVALTPPTMCSVKV